MLIGPIQGGDLMGMVIMLAMFGTIGWVWVNKIRVKHGYQLTDLWGRPIEKASSASAETVKQLELQVAVQGERLQTLEQRTRVLERIVTDRGQTVADEIDRLRDSRAN
ncbi:hypothetical protein E6W36_07580 [Hankyongella ginsenosidimutans]|uniref:Uncharacterized protein n=1 Tax=Hankyongella ginsenosidimutans TaxID=1763828 RepID=A0A4D7C9B9_9SPHN|nr:hypothetical protein [Hankyongella ginsenosidimutans]QCI79457.1 hypothetical protein E6W36_07580 [Hankyongella ginsenosidimutans]TXG83841.1 MAG: hypothetical protein E6R12_06820 [Sphingomonadales bacterium]